MANLPDEEFIERIAGGIELTAEEAAPSRLKAKVYSALMQRQTETGPLVSLTETKACGRDLCVFEELVRIAPIGESAKSLNICRVCHARVLAEHVENAPIYWSGCPYVELKKT
jgi:hypothetical protein